MILAVCWDSLWTLSFGFSQFHGHGSWLVCEVTLSECTMDVFSLRGFLHGIKWIMFHGHLDYIQNHLLKVGLTQNHETMALQNLTTIDLLYFIRCEDYARIQNLLK